MTCFLISEMTAGHEVMVISGVDVGMYLYRDVASELLICAIYNKAIN